VRVPTTSCILSAMEPVDAEFLALIKKNNALYCPTLWVLSGYGTALSGAWRPTAAEQRLADPQILSMLANLEPIPKEDMSARLTQRIAESAAPAHDHVAKTSRPCSKPVCRSSWAPMPATSVPFTDPRCSVVKWL